MTSFEVFSRHCHGKGETHQEVPHDSWSLERDLSLGPPESEAELLTFYRDLQWFVFIFRYVEPLSSITKQLFK